MLLYTPRSYYTYFCFAKGDLQLLQDARLGALVPERRRVHRDGPDIGGLVTKAPQVTRKHTHAYPAYCAISSLEWELRAMLIILEKRKINVQLNRINATEI